MFICSKNQQGSQQTESFLSPPQQQCWLKAVCVLRPSPSQAIVGVLVGLLGRYAAGVRYALELQALHKGTAESCQPEDDNTNQSVSSIEDDFVTALEHLEEEEDNCRFITTM